MPINSVDQKKSRYVQGGDTDRLSNRLGWWERITLPSHPTDFSFLITARYHQRPDLVAKDVYGSANLMWLVLQYLNIVDINTEFVSGKTILIPTTERVLSSLLGRSTGGKKKP